jgi:hypothetical protein
MLGQFYVLAMYCWKCSREARANAPYGGGDFTDGHALTLAEGRRLTLEQGIFHHKVRLDNALWNLPFDGHAQP